jgi:hypothetical protein
LNPGSLKVTEYVPGFRLRMVYRPAPSVTPTRVFSISAGLEASAVTPGSTAPVESCTTPEMLPPNVWALVGGEDIRRTSSAAIATNSIARLIRFAPFVETAASVG